MAWKANFRLPTRKQNKVRTTVERDERNPKPKTREDARRFWHTESKNPEAKATKRSHGAKKVENRARNKRARKARKANR